LLELRARTRLLDYLIQSRDIASAWAVQSFPYWLLLDADGRVVEARLKRQTVAQLEQLLARG
jgi:hypothetical protein